VGGVGCCGVVGGGGGGGGGARSCFLGATYIRLEHPQRCYLSKQNYGIFLKLQKYFVSKHGIKLLHIT